MNKLRNKRRPAPEANLTNIRPRYTANVKIARQGVSGHGSRFVELEFYHARRWHSILVPIDDLMTRRAHAFRTLSHAGLHLVPPAARNELINRIQAELPACPTFLVATRLGWTGARFALPATADDKPCRNVHLQSVKPALLGKYQTNGTLEGAAEIMALAQGNSRFMLAIALAFAGPVVPLLRSPSITIGFIGPARCGGTAMVAAASSLWGRHTDGNTARHLGFGEPWDGQGSSSPLKNPSSV